MKFTNLIVVVALMMGDLHLYAQSASVEYSSELQTNFRNNKFVNLLRINTEMPFGKHCRLEASTISIAKTGDEKLVDDLQTFSNIEEDNLPLALAICGANWKINDKHTVFTGIRNMNEDYFTSPITSFFTNSSCGIFPTISANFPIANYPVVSLGVHYCYDGDPIKVEASLYNGTGYNHFTGHKNIFRFCPKEDGLFELTEVSYKNDRSFISIGNAIYWKDGMNDTPWLYAEQSVFNKLTLLASFSHSFTERTACENFIGLGIHYQIGKYQLGIFTDYASFREIDEFATELTCKYAISKQVNLQPTIHIIASDSGLNYITMMRMTITI